MSPKLVLYLLPLSLVLFAAGDRTWRDKQIAEWSEDDARQVLADSPWSKTVTPTFSKSEERGRQGGGMGGGGGISVGGIGIGLPGLGGRSRSGGSRGGGGGYPGGGQRPGGPGGEERSFEPPDLTLRWESALPVRSAELKARETNAPTLASDYYAVAVYGVPRRMASEDSGPLSAQLKKQAALKRDGKKDLKPENVEVLEREDGPVIVYMFPRTKEIVRQDKRVQFDARVGPLEITTSFYLDDMVYQGKLEL